MARKGKGGGRRRDRKDLQPAGPDPADKAARDAELFRQWVDSEPVPDKDAEEATAPPASGKGKSRQTADKPLTIDLHGLTIPEALRRVDEVLAQLPPGQTTTLRIITGKGRHSAGGSPVLAAPVHHHIRSTRAGEILRIDDSPHAVTIDGRPIRGHFDVVIRT